MQCIYPLGTKNNLQNTKFIDWVETPTEAGEFYYFGMPTRGEIDTTGMTTSTILKFWVEADGDILFIDMVSTAEEDKSMVNKVMAHASSSPL